MREERWNCEIAEEQQLQLRERGGGGGGNEQTFKLFGYRRMWLDYISGGLRAVEVAARRDRWKRGGHMVRTFNFEGFCFI